MRFLYTTVSLALFAATAQAYSTGSPVCKSDDATLGKVAAAGKMGKQADAAAFGKTWSFALWDDNGEVDGDMIMTNMDYWVTVKGGDYKGVMVYPMFDGQRVPKGQESKVVTLDAGDDTFQSAKCASDVGQTITHTSADTKDDTAKVAKVRVLDDGAGKFMLSGIVVTGKSTFGKAVTQQYELMAGKNGTGDNGDDTGDNGDDTDNGNTGGGNGDGGNTGAGNDGTGTGTGTDNVDPNGASSISFVRPAIALQLIALAAFVLI